MTPAEERACLLAQAVDAAARLGGVVSSVCAAMTHGWEVKCTPRCPQITVARNVRLDKADTVGVQVRRLDLPAAHVAQGATTLERTVLDCTRSLPFDEALCVADSALRHGLGWDRLLDLASQAKGPGSRQARWVARHATPLAANPLESVLRAIALGAGLDVRPQLRIGGEHFLGTPDLVDLERRIVLEADSFEHHGSRAALRRDASRYNEFAAHGWLVLRFTWGDVMLRPEQVRRVILAAIAQRRTERD